MIENASNKSPNLKRDFDTSTGMLTCLNGLIASKPVFGMDAADSE